MKKLMTAAVFALATLAIPATFVASPALAQQMHVVSGSFTDTDSVHKGAGTATITKAENGDLSVDLSDFATIPGPDLKVYLVEAGNIKSSDDVKNSTWLSLGALQSSKGNQSYKIPAGTDTSKYNSVTIWCEQFGVLFTTADLS